MPERGPNSPVRFSALPAGRPRGQSSSQNAMDGFARVKPASSDSMPVGKGNPWRLPPPTSADKGLGWLCPRKACAPAAGRQKFRRLGRSGNPVRHGTCVRGFPLFGVARGCSRRLAGRAIRASCPSRCSGEKDLTAQQRIPLANEAVAAPARATVVM